MLWRRSSGSRSTDEAWQLPPPAGRSPLGRAVVAGCANPGRLPGAGRRMPGSPGSTPRSRRCGRGVLCPAACALPRAEPCRPDRAPECSDTPPDRCPPPSSAARPGRAPGRLRHARIVSAASSSSGVDQNTLTWGRPRSHERPADRLRRRHAGKVAKAIFGRPRSGRHPRHLHGRPQRDRAQAVASGEVDLVAETMTITCERAARGNRKRAVPSDLLLRVYYCRQGLPRPTARRTSTADLDGKRVCATKGSTSIDKSPALPVTQVIAWQADHARPTASSCCSRARSTPSAPTTRSWPAWCSRTRPEVMTDADGRSSPCGTSRTASPSPGPARARAVRERGARPGPHRPRHRWAGPLRKWLCPRRERAPAEPAARRPPTTG